jgi:2-polyprenyl-3-methyl-5-hydroxy-6-metoxy-1,4-benzoquinol methylase
MAMKDVSYTFRPVERCNMCRASADKFRLMGQRLNDSQGFRPSKKIGITTRVVQCSECGLIFANPTPIPNDIQDHYGVVPEEYWKSEYFQVNEEDFMEEVNWLKKLKTIRPGMKYLDIGAGLGKQMIVLQNQGFDVYGIEPSIQFYSYAIEKMGIDKDHLQLSSIESAKFEANSFDFISFGSVLEHLYDPSSGLYNALQWLKPDGLIHIEVPNARWLMSKIINTAYWITGKDYVGNISPMHVPYHLFEFSLESFQKNGLINKYAIRDSGYYVCDTYFPKIFDPILKTWMKNTGTGMQLTVWLEKNGL